MVAQSPPFSRNGIQRFLDDLRSYGDRRVAGDRRRLDQPVEVERRVGVDRRTRSDRRRRSAGSYGPRVLEEIQRMLADHNVRAACPECDGSLMLGPTVRRGDIAVRHIHCTGCRRSVELPVADSTQPAAG